MLASYPHSRATSSTAAIYGGNRRRDGAIAHRDGGIIHGGGRIGRTGGCLGPFMRRLTPQVVAQAGRPHCHLSGPAAQERVTTTSKGAHRPTRAQSGARAQNHGVNVQTLPTRRREQMPPPSIPTFPHQKAKKSRHQQHAASYNPDMTAYCGLEELGLVAVGMRCGSSGVCRGLLRCPISHRCPISRRCPISHRCPTSVIS